MQKAILGRYEKISDEICREYGLSVIEPQKRGYPTVFFMRSKTEKQTVRSQIRADIDEIIKVSLNFTVFLELLKKEGVYGKASKCKAYCRKATLQQEVYPSGQPWRRLQ